MVQCASTVTVDDKTYTIANPNDVARVNNARDVPNKAIGSSIKLPVYPGGFKTKRREKELYDEKCRMD